MQSRLLRSFLVVAEQGSITEAARILHVSQPALTKNIRRLEDEFDVKLFDRSSVGVSLTRYGEILLDHVKVMENEYRHAMARMNELRDGGQVSLRVGAGPVWLVRILPPIIAQFQAEKPNVRVSLIGGVIDTLVPELVNGNLDVICVSLDFPNRPEIVKHPLFKIRHVLVADPSHPLAHKTEVDAPDIHDFPWMVLKSDYVGIERIFSFFAANGLKPPNITFETTSINSLLYGLTSGMHVAHIPEQMLPQARQMGLKEIKLRQSIWETKAGYVYRKADRLLEPTRDFMARLQELAEMTTS